MTDRLNEVQKIINGYFDSIDSEAFGRFRADFSFGKMLRSKLLLSIAPNSPTAPRICAIIELIHFASLLHDDVIDSANLRRGKQSINAKYGDKNAIMLGDILYSKAFYEVACIPCVGANLSQIISNAVFRLSLGELDDVFLGESINLDDKKYLKMVERKTAALIEASAVCGGILKSDLSLDSSNSVLGMQFRTCENFGESTDSSLVLSPKFSQIQKPHRNHFDCDSLCESTKNNAQSAESSEKIQFKKPFKSFCYFWLLPKVESPLPLNPNLPNKDKFATINIGIIGRVNVGKSSILNALLGKERSLVSEIEGTTIDPVSDEIIYKDKILRFVDTAGIRRASKIEGIEKFALSRTKRILEQSNIVLLVLDASSDFVELDEKISGLSQKYNLGIIILLNKWDIKCADFRAFSEIIKRKFAYLSYAPILTISALKMRHIDEIKATILRVWENFNRRIPTALLNEHIKIATMRHPLPSERGKIVKVYYASQVDCAPPQIVLVMNRPRALHFSYKRYLVNYFRANFDFSGVPIVILSKGRGKDEIAE